MTGWLRMAARTRSPARCARSAAARSTARTCGGVQARGQSAAFGASGEARCGAQMAELLRRSLSAVTLSLPVMGGAAAAVVGGGVVGPPAVRSRSSLQRAGDRQMRLGMQVVQGPDA